MADLLIFSLIVSSHQNLITSSIDISEAREEERKERKKVEEVKTSLDCPPLPSPFFPDTVLCLLSPPGHAWYISSPFLLSSLLLLFHAVWLEL